MNDEIVNCNYCGKKCRPRNLYMHIIQVHEKKFECADCGKRFGSKRNLRRHVESHIKYGLQKCPICGKTCKNKVGLMKHVKSHKVHESKRYKCSICNRRFSGLCSFSTHTLCHTGEKIYQCLKCNKEFTLRRRFMQHIHAHWDTVPFQCSNCGKRFPQQSLLLEHKTTHSNQKVYQCSKCNKQYKSEYGMTRHIYNHLLTMYYKCLQCNKQFKTSVGFREHKMKHITEMRNSVPNNNGQCTSKDTSLQTNQEIKERPQCTECSTSYICEAHRSNFMNFLFVDFPLKSFQCFHCNKSFATKYHLHRHMWAQMGYKSFQCSQCGKTFVENYDLARHKRIHSSTGYVCSVCGNLFSSIYRFDKHLCHSDKSLGTSCADRKATPISSEPKNSNDARYGCAVCEKRFKRKSHLTEHLQIHKHPFSYTNYETQLNCNKLFQTQNAVHTQAQTYEEETRQRSDLNLQVSKTHNVKQKIKSLRRMYQCEDCGQRFPNKGLIRIHMMDVGKARRHQCSNCGILFSSKCHLMRHCRLSPSCKNSFETSTKSFLEQDAVKREIEVSKNNDSEEHEEKHLNENCKINSDIENQEYCKDTELKEPVPSEAQYNTQFTNDHYENDNQNITYTCINNRKQSDKEILMIIGRKQIQQTVDILNEPDKGSEGKNIKVSYKAFHNHDESKNLEEITLKQSDNSEYNAIQPFEKTKQSDDSLATFKHVFGDKHKDKLNKKKTFFNKQLTMFMAKLNESSSEYKDLITTAMHDLHKAKTLVQVPLSELYRSIWKFKCNFEEVTVNAKDEACAIEYPSVWRIKNYSRCPPFIRCIIKAFEEFFQKLPDEISTLLRTHNQKEKKYAMTIIMQVNSLSEIMIKIIDYAHNSLIKEELQNYISSHPDIFANVKSLYYTTLHSKVELLHGVKYLYEIIDGIKIKLSSKMESSLNVKCIEILSSTIANYLTPCAESTLLNVGCGNGLIGLLLASKYKEVIGVDCWRNVKAAKKLCRYNKIKNVTFHSDEIKNIEVLFQTIKEHNQIMAVIDQSSNCGQSLITMDYLQKLMTVTYIVIVTPFTEQCFPSILKLMEPINGILNSCFIPMRFCIIDHTPGEDCFNFVILMKRVSV